MLDRTLTRRSLIGHATTAAAGATGLGVLDDRWGNAGAADDDAAAPADCANRHVEPDVAVVDARREDGRYVVQAGEAVTFDASGTESTAPVDAFEWDFGTEQVEGERVHHAWERGGDVATVELAVTDRAGRTASASVQVAVETRDRYDEAPIPVHDASPARTYDDGYIVRAGERVTFDARESRDPDGDVVAYEWGFRGESREGAVVERTFRRAGNYVVTLSVTDDTGTSASVDVPVHVAR
ncbi:PKD domain-containing protein [Halorubellus sp. JP-L1]|uniref:PKD domain-containing protein n=1 Tax=Halorubellus sp. JP-L1 TaxID=2715753 RepID=UPI00140C3637|nr:PKD domain-containing protein [Halorubellus sp. JP-L1]NHN41380.1 PKD domain-containing protein [Halorubellus sp. JP-L1]